MAVEDSVAQDRIRAFVERIERMEEEKKALSEDIKSIYAEAKGNGFDVKILRRVVGIRKQDANERMEQEAILELYMSALGMCAAPPSYNEERERLNSLASKVEASLRKPKTEEKPDALAALKANPALSIVSADNLKKSEPQPPQPAGSDLADPEPLVQVADIQPETANETPDAGMRRLDDLGSVQDGLKMSSDGQLLGADREPPQSEFAREVQGDPQQQSLTGGESAATNSTDDGLSEAPKAETAKSVSASALAAPAPKYADPGVVVWENTPPEPVKRHDYSYAFGELGQDIAVIEDDLANAAAEPIVKIGCEILDGWARYTKARSMVGLDGMPVDYSVMQYDGADPLMDCIRWNLAGRILNDAQKRLIAQRLAKLEPKRKADIYAAMELGMELVA